VKSKFVFTEENGSLGPTREAAEADLHEALLTEHDARQAAEDEEDIRLADESRAEIRAGGVTISLEDVLKRYGLGSVKVGIVSDIHGTSSLSTLPSAIFAASAALRSSALATCSTSSLSARRSSSVSKPRERPARAAPATAGHAQVRCPTPGRAARPGQ